MTNSVTPSPNRAKAPAFHDMEAGHFEEMSCAIYEKEPGISIADLYKTARKPQFGIDVIAHRANGSGIEVASCKCYSTIKKGKIPEWSNDFLDHWDAHWKNREVQKFVLIVATFINSVERETEITIEKVRFAAINVEYEVWGARQLQEKLRNQAGIVSQFLGPEWVTRLCGLVPSIGVAPVTDAGALSALVVAQIGALQEALSGEVEKRLDSAFEEVLRGNLETIDIELANLRLGGNWGHLLPKTQARLVRLQGSLRLQHGDLEGAERFADEADAIAQASEPRLRALLAARRDGAEKGLEILGDPDSREGVQLKIALLLDSGCIDDAIDFLESNSALDAPHAETERLRALANLIKGRREDAFSAIQRAEQLAPDRPAVKRAGAIVRYALALSPLVTVEWTLHPNPIDLDLVKEDDNSRALLLEACARFNRLVCQDVDEETRHQDEAWELACLCNLRDRWAEAEERCQEILQRDPTHSGAINWALARGFDIDRVACSQALRQLLDQGQGGAEKALLLAWVLVADGREQETEMVMEQYADRFDSPSFQTMRQRWLSDLAARKTDAVSGDSVSDTSPPNQLSLLVDRANLTKDWEPIEQFFGDLMSAATPPPLTLAAAQFLAAAERWEVISKFSDNLLRFATTGAIRIAVFAAINTGNPKRALGILDNWRSAFPRGSLPRELRVIEMEALRLSGNPAAALRHAAVFAAESSSLVDRLVEANLQVRTGNLMAALPAIRAAADAKVLSPPVALRLSTVIGIEDRELARSLWRQAIACGVPRELSTAALMQAFRLGLEQEAAPIFGQISQIAHTETDIVRIVTVEELIEQQSHWRDKAANLQRLYLNGAIPIHLITEHGNVNLAKIYQLSDSGIDMALQLTPLMIRNGARPAHIDIGLPISEWRFHLDITALLVAAELNLLDTLEHLPHPLVISPSLPEALYTLELQSYHHQPRHMTAMRVVLDAVATGSVTVSNFGDEGGVSINNLDDHQAAALLVAVRAGGIVVDHDLPQGVSVENLAYFTTLRAITDGLLNAGMLDLSAHEDALSRLGQYSHDGGVPPTPGAELFFLTNTLIILAEAGLMDAALATYNLNIDPVIISIAREEIKQADEGDKLGTLLSALRQRVGQGIVNGRYLTLAASCEVEDREDSRKRKSKINKGQISLVERCLYDLLEAPSSPGAVIWIDDRNLSGYPKSQESPIVGIYEVLNIMRKADLINEEAHHTALLRLRVANAMFLPIEADEILYHLSLAPISNGNIIETPGLVTIRRYFANIILLENHLKIGDSPGGLEGRPDEIQILFEVRRLAEICIIKQWTKPNLSDEVRRARSVWVWSALRVERFFRLPKNTSDSNADYTLAALLICNLLTGAIQIVRKNPEKMLVDRKSYLLWTEGIIEKKIETDPHLVKEIVRFLTQLLLGLIDTRDTDCVDPKIIPLTKRYLRILVEQFPESIRKHLNEDENFCHKLGIKVVSVVTVGDASFEASRFWSSAGKALANGRARIRTLKEKRRVEICRVPDREYTLKLTGAIQSVISDPAFGILQDSPSSFRELFERHPEWLDLRVADRLKAIENITTLESPAGRIEALQRFRDSSAEFLYSRFEDKFTSDKSLTFDDFRPPSADALLNHLRFPRETDISFATRLSISAEALVEEHGPFLAFTRLSGIPVAIPEPVIKALISLPAAERKKVLTDVSAIAQTPLQMIHALRLQIILAEKENLNEGLLPLLSRLFDHWRMRAKVFISILRWTNAAFERDLSWKSLPAPERLALVWTHSDRLTAIFISNNVDFEYSAKFFSQNHLSRPFDQLLRLDSGFDQAVAHPDLIDETNLLFHGFGYVLGNEIADQILPASCREQLRELLTVELDGTRLMSPWLFSDRRAGDNELGSFLLQRPNGIFEPPTDISDESVTREVDQMLSALEATPLSCTTWFGLWVLGRPKLGTAERLRLNTVLRKIDLAELARTEPDNIVVWQIIGDCSNRLGGGETRPEVVEQLKRAACYFSGQYPGKIYSLAAEPLNSAQRGIAQLLEATLILSRDSAVAQAYERFGETLVSIANSWPNSAPVFREIVEKILADARIEDTQGLWKSGISLRSFP